MKKRHKIRDLEKKAVIIAAILIFVSLLFLGKSTITGLIVYDQSTSFEAESMKLTGTYSSTSYCICSNPSNGLCIRNTGYTGQVGNVIYNFSMDKGLYDISMKHCPDSDGSDIYNLYINGNLTKTFQTTSHSQAWEDHLFESIGLNPGDEVKISCAKPSGATYCRIDQVTFNKIRSTVDVNETIKDADNIPIPSTVRWKKSGQTVLESSGETRSYQLESGDYNLEIVPDHSSIKKIEMVKTVSSGITDIVGVDSDPYPDTQYSKVYAIDPKDSGVTNANVTITATGTELYKCKDWDFGARTCPNENWVKLMDTVPGQEYTFVVDCGYKEKGGCSCKGIRFVDLLSNYNFINGSSYSVTAEVFKGSGTTQLIDSETISFNSLPKSNIDNNPGTDRGNLKILSINGSGIKIKFQGASGSKLYGDNTFRIKVNSNTIGPQTIHLSCSQPIDIGDSFGSYTVTDIDKIISGSSCNLPDLHLVSPSDNSAFSTGNISLDYYIFDSNQSIDTCKLYINNNFYATDSNITEGIERFSVSLADGNYDWKVKCVTSNGYEVNSNEWSFTVNHHLNCSDSDADGICNEDDNCISVYNPGQEDSDNDGMGNACDSCNSVTLSKTPINAQLHSGADVTSKVQYSDNLYAYQVVNAGSWYIYLNWTNSINSSASIEKTILALEHQEYQTNMSVQWLDGLTWRALCDPADSASDKVDYCDMSSFIDSAQKANSIYLRLRLVQTGGCHENLDWALMNITYCVPKDNPPDAKLVSPANGYISTSKNVSFTCNATDDKKLSNITFFWNYSGTWQANGTVSVNGTSSQATFQKTNLSNGAIKWNCQACDNNSQCSFAPANWTVMINSTLPDTTPPVVSLVSPPNNSIFYNGTMTLNYNVTDNSPISFCELVINNSVVSTNYSVTRNITQSFTYSLANGTYEWYVNCTDIYNNRGMSQKWIIKIITNQTVINDTTAPTVHLVSPPNNSIDTDGYITFSYNVTDNSSISFCDLVIGDTVIQTDYTVTRNITQSFTQTLSNGFYSWYVNCTDIYNNRGQSEIWALKVNKTEQAANQTACCCGLRVSTTPEVASQGEKVLVTADVSNLFTGLAATPGDILAVNATIYRIENNSQTTIVSGVPMTYLSNGIWYYEFNVGNNATGTYIASVTMLTNQTFPFIKEASDSFTVGETVSGLTITGVSPDLINVNKTTRLAAEVKYNGIAVDDILITNASLFVLMINGTNQTYTTSNGLHVVDGMMYVDGAFNETGVYYLDWSATYLGKVRTAREISVVVGWENLLVNISNSINTNLISMINESRSYLLNLLTNMESLQQFTEEEVFLITDSVNSMTKVADYLQGGNITNEEAQKQFDDIKAELMAKLGDKMTGSVIAGDKSKKSAPLLQRISEQLRDWRVILFISILVMFGMVVSILLVLTRTIRQWQPVIMQGKEKISAKPQIKPSAGKRRYEMILENIGEKFGKKKGPKTKPPMNSMNIGKRRYEVLLSKLKEKMPHRKKDSQPKTYIAQPKSAVIENPAETKSRYNLLMDKIKKKTEKKTESIDERLFVLPGYMPEEIMRLQKTKPQASTAVIEKAAEKQKPQKQALPDSKRDISRRCEYSNEFILHDGRKLSSIKSLETVLATLSDYEFAYHANSERNDFSNWIKFVFGYPGLADKIRAAKSQKEAIKAINEYFRS